MMSHNLFSYKVNIYCKIPVAHQLSFNYRLMKELSEFENKKPIFKKIEKIYIQFIWSIHEYYNFLPDNIKIERTVSIIENIYFKRHIIKTDNIIVIKTDNDVEFYRVHKIICKEKTFALITNKIESFLNEHFNAYEIETSSCKWNLILKKNLYDYSFTYPVKTYNGKLLIVKNGIIQNFNNYFKRKLYFSDLIYF